jgi:hypothetical protein
MSLINGPSKKIKTGLARAVDKIYFEKVYTRIIIIAVVVLSSILMSSLNGTFQTRLGTFSFSSKKVGSVVSTALTMLSSRTCMVQWTCRQLQWIWMNRRGKGWLN